jgi:hypothetical protein
MSINWPHSGGAFLVDVHHVKRDASFNCDRCWLRFSVVVHLPPHAGRSDRFGTSVRPTTPSNGSPSANGGWQCLRDRRKRSDADAVSSREARGHTPAGSVTVGKIARLRLEANSLCLSELCTEVMRVRGGKISRYLIPNNHILNSVNLSSGRKSPQVCCSQHSLARVELVLP